MMELGIDLKVIIIQMINFAVLYIIFKKYLYKPIIDFLDKRTKLVSGNVKLKQTLLSDKEKLEAKEKKVMSKAKRDADKLLKNAKTEASKMKRDIEKEAKVEAKRIITKAQETAKISSHRSKSNISAKMRNITLDVAKELLPGLVNKQQNEAITAEAVKRFVNLS